MQIQLTHSLSTREVTRQEIVTLLSTAVLCLCVQRFLHYDKLEAPPSKLELAPTA